MEPRRRRPYRLCRVGGFMGHKNEAWGVRPVENPRGRSISRSRLQKRILFHFYDLSDMEIRILFGFYHLAKNREGRGIDRVRFGAGLSRLALFPLCADGRIFSARCGGYRLWSTRSRPEAAARVAVALDVEIDPSECGVGEQCRQALLPGWRWLALTPVRS